MKSFIVLSCFLSLFICTLADVEYEHHGHHHAHDGHNHHDHKSHEKLFTGGIDDDVGYSQREKLRLIARKVDINADGKINHEEMRVYVNERVQDQNQREADDFISALDQKNEKKVTFDAFVEDNYGQTDIKEILQSKQNDGITRETRRTYLADKKKWETLDKDGDGSLTYDEFRSFFRPENHPELLEIEVNSMLDEYDINKDRKLSNEEYRFLTEAETGQAESLSEDLDLNGDGFADAKELSQYYWPTEEANVNEETNHLMKECDTDKDGFCTYDDIVNAYSSFAGSQVTDYGAELDSDHEDL